MPVCNYLFIIIITPECLHIGHIINFHYRRGSLIKDVYFQRSFTVQYFKLHWMVFVLFPTYKFAWLPCWYCWWQEVKRNQDGIYLSSVLFIIIYIIIRICNIDVCSCILWVSLKLATGWMTGIWIIFVWIS